MEYTYAALLLAETGREISERNLTTVLEAAGGTVERSRGKAFVAALEEVDIDELTEAGTPDGVTVPTETKSRDDTAANPAAAAGAVDSDEATDTAADTADGESATPDSPPDENAFAAGGDDDELDLPGVPDDTAAGRSGDDVEETDRGWSALQSAFEPADDVAGDQSGQSDGR